MDSSGSVFARNRPDGHHISSRSFMDCFEIIERGREGRLLGENDLAALLGSDNQQVAAALYEAANELRKKYHGDAVYLRGIIEFSNYCRLNCKYCGIRRENRGIPRYRMPPEEIIAAAVAAANQGCGTVVLQSGEDRWYTSERLADIIRGIKSEARIAVTLSIGERSAGELQALKEAGADRYLLRFETSNRGLFTSLHPDDDYDSRIHCLEVLRELGYQLGSGFMIGLPSSNLLTVARDILFATRLNLDMIGCGPFIPAPGTPLSQSSLFSDNEMYFKTIALLRVLNPAAHIPSTTAFDALLPGGRDRVLGLGANVFMPNMTPLRYRRYYQLYANKPCVDQNPAECLTCIADRLRRLGRTIAQGPGHSIRAALIPAEKPL